MAIKVSQAFERTSAAPIDSSIALTKAQMLAVNDNLMPAYYFTICQDDGKIYLYDKTATPSATTGKFTEFSGGGGGSSDVKFFTTTDTLNKEINGTKVVVAADLPGITWSDLVVGSSVIKDAEGTMGLVTIITDTTSVTVTTATTSTPTKELTQAEYDALTEAEKKNGTIYFITDNYVGSTYVGAYDTIYSTTERVVGSYMGKPLYQKTWTSSTRESISNTEWGQQFSIPKAGIEQLVQCICSDNQYGQAWKVLANLDTSATYVSFMACRDNSGISATDVTLQYTKTTDSTSPVEYASPNDYSTSEKIVGTWIDGKPLYQKTVNCGAMPNNSTKQVSHEISDIGIIVDNKIFGYKVSDNTYVSVPFVHWIDKTVDVEASCNNSNIIIRSKSDWSAFNCYATIQYTKTTD